jgi:hypothetical protein
MTELVTEKLGELEERIKSLEYANDRDLFASYMAHHGKVTLFCVIEDAVCDVFNLKKTAFFRTLNTGSSTGRSKKRLPIEPKEIMDQADRTVAARHCLYAILYYEFHIGIPRLSTWYSANTYNYIQTWKDRYHRIFSRENEMIEGDHTWREYWQRIFKRAVEIFHEKGMYNEFVAYLSERSDEGEDKLAKWRT